MAETGEIKGRYPLHADGREFDVTLRGGRFYITTSRGTMYVACQAYIGDEDTMKFVGGRNGYTLARTRNGEELHMGLAALAEAVGVRAGYASEHVQ